MEIPANCNTEIHVLLTECKIDACLKSHNNLKSEVLLLMPWWPSCLDGGALINVEAPGCGTSVV